MNVFDARRILFSEEGFERSLHRSSLMLQHVVALRKAVPTTTSWTVTRIPLRSYASAQKTPSNRDNDSAQRTANVKSRPNLLTFTYQPRPKPLNCTTHYSTSILAREADTVMGMKIRRAKQSFNPDNFIWVARCPVDMCKKSTYRHLIVKKIRKVFVQELEKRGYDRDGKIVSQKGESESGTEAKRDLRGALLILLNSQGDKAKALNATSEELRAALQYVFEKVLPQQSDAPGRNASLRPGAAHQRSETLQKRGSNVLYRRVWGERPVRAQSSTSPEDAMMSERSAEIVDKKSVVSKQLMTREQRDSRSGNLHFAGARTKGFNHNCRRSGSSHGTTGVS